MNSVVPHLWGLSFMYTRMRLNYDLDGSMASSNAIMDGGIILTWNVSWGTLMIDHCFQARPLATRRSPLLLKCRFHDICANRSQVM
ncbi:hypothetical protein PHMEG_0005500 [Phytophthora megakarya]|uniref:Uncharacterized protein n=1 Tax=Phytophthora megakarya TaxID=4795 RepID=A0A225WRD5_9STRA|nr:hypothetical protein PHMEG_0005500 [Phytophthora megakarya]